MKKVAKVFISGLVMLCLLVHPASIAWANDSNVQDEDLFSVFICCKDQSVDLSNIKIDVYSATLAYAEEESGYYQYEETFSFSVETDSRGVVTFCRPSDEFSITICIDSLPEDFGIVDRHTSFFSKEETAYYGVVSKIESVFVEQEYYQLIPVLKDEYGNNLVADAQVIDLDEDNVERSALFVDENSKIIAFDETVTVVARGKNYPVLNHVQYEYQTELEKAKYLLDKKIISAEAYANTVMEYLTSDAALESENCTLLNGTELFMEVGNYCNTANIQEDFSNEIDGWQSLTQATANNAYVVSGSGRFRVYYDSTTVASTVARNVAAEFDSVDTLFCVNWGFLRPYTDSNLSYYRVDIVDDMSGTGLTVPSNDTSGLGSKIQINRAVAIQLGNCINAVEYPEAYKGVIAHEYMHAIMMRYGIKGEDRAHIWMHDCFATWAGFAYEKDYGALISESINYFLDTHHMSLTSAPVTGTNVDRRLGSCIFAICIDQHMGGYSTIENILSAYSTDQEPLTVIDSGLRNSGYSLSEAYVLCATYNYDIAYFYTSTPANPEYAWEYSSENSERELPFATENNWGNPALACHYHAFSAEENTYSTLAVTIDYVVLNDPSNAKVNTIRIRGDGYRVVGSEGIVSSRCTIVQSGFGGWGAQKLVVMPINASHTRTVQYTMTAEAKYAPLDGMIYSIQNVGTGKYLNVHYGLDQNNVNVYQWTKDGSREQNFKLDMNDNGSYYIRAMCSSDGTNRVLDIVKSDGQVVDGCNVQIYTAVDPQAQEWFIYTLGNGLYRISPRSNPNLALAVYGSANGTANGTSSLSVGNVFVTTYTGEASQLWRFVPAE